MSENSACAKDKVDFKMFIQISHTCFLPEDFFILKSFNVACIYFNRISFLNEPSWSAKYKKMTYLLFNFSRSRGI